MANVGERAVEGDAVTDVNVEAILPVGLIHPVGVCQRERFPLLAVTWVKCRHTQAVTCRKHPQIAKIRWLRGIKRHIWHRLLQMEPSTSSWLTAHITRPLFLYFSHSLHWLCLFCVSGFLSDSVCSVTRLRSKIDPKLVVCGAQKALGSFTAPQLEWTPELQPRVWGSELRPAATKVFTLPPNGTGHIGHFSG